MCILPVQHDSDELPFVRERLCWRMLPSESFSDWTIEVVVSSTKECTCYHVHRNILAVGPCSSDYFSRVCRNKGFVESASKTSRIELHPLAAQFFPMMLDYCYGGTIDFDDENVLALYSLGEYFQVRRLCWEAKRYWQMNMTLGNCGLYFLKASVFQTEEALNAVKELCIQYFACMGFTLSYVFGLPIPENSIFRVAGPDFWVGVLEAAQDLPNPPNFGSWTSIFVAFVLNQVEHDDTEIFEKLTDERFLPEIDPNAARTLLKVYDRLFPNGQAEELSCFQNRCVKALAATNIDSEAETEELIAFLVKQNSFVLKEILKRLDASVRTTLTVYLERKLKLRRGPGKASMKRKRSLNSNKRSCHLRRSIRKRLEKGKYRSVPLAL